MTEKGNEEKIYLIRSRKINFIHWNKLFIQLKNELLPLSRSSAQWQNISIEKTFKHLQMAIYQMYQMLFLCVSS